MFVTDSFYYIHLQKTGGTRITEILSQLVKGERQGTRHNYLEHTPYSKFVFGSIRNPLEWYVSIWAFGCEGRGGVMGWLKDDETMQRLYSDAESIDHFREWLKTVYQPEYIRLMGNGYPLFDLNNEIGLMTWRYAYLYNVGIKTSECPPFDSYDDFIEYDQKHNMVDGWIRLENLPGTITECLQKAGHIVPRKRLETLCKEKSNTSKHLPWPEYYDDTSLETIIERERFIFDKHGYNNGNGQL